MKPFFSCLLAAGLLAVSCQLPGPMNSSSSGQFWIKTNAFAAGPTGRTVLPSAVPFHYSVALTGAANLTFNNLTGLTEPFSAPMGAYTLTVTLFNAGNQVIGQSAPQAVSVAATPASNQFAVTVNPTKTGSGTVNISYSWPPLLPDSSLLADSAVVSMIDLDHGNAVVDLSGGLSNANVSAGTAGVAGSFPSGTYLVNLALTKTIGGVVYRHPTVTEVVQVYDNLTSTKPYLLTAADLNGPPAAPTAFTATYSGTSFDVSWTAGPGTQLGYRFYRNGVLVSSPTLGQTSDSDPSPPAVYNEYLEIAAYNAFGESARRAQTISFTALSPSTAYGLSVGYSDTTGPTKTTMELRWTNPTQDPITVYRASNLAGPYTAIHSDPGTGTSFQDSEAAGLAIGTTYYYAIADAPGLLLSLPFSTLYGGSWGTPYIHTDPVPGVVSGTTMGWNALYNQAVPVVGTPYLVPDTSQIPPLSGADPWADADIPTTAILVGGYTYWAWGKDADNTDNTMIAAFDSHRVYRQSTVLYQRYVSGLAVSGTDVEVSGQRATNKIAWATLDWFKPVTVAVTVNFSVPSAPSITLSGAAVLDKTPMAQTMSVDPLLSSYSGGTLRVIQWTIDGAAEYPDLGLGTSPFTVDPDPAVGTITVDSALLSVGTHELLLLVTDGTSIYSANFTFTVVLLPQPS